MQSSIVTKQFSGKLLALGGSLIPVNVRVSYGELDHKKIDIEIVYNASRKRSVAVTVEIERCMRGEPLLIRSDSQSKEVLSIERIYSFSNTPMQGIAVVRANSISVGFFRHFVSQKDDVYFNFCLRPGNVLAPDSIRILQQDGAVKVKKQKINRPFWRTPGGKFTFDDTFSRVKDVSMFGSREVIDRSTVVSVAYVPSQKKEMKTIKDELEPYFVVVRSLLCLCSRKDVDLYEIDATVIRRKGRRPKRQFTSPVHRFQLDSADLGDENGIDPLLHITNITGKAFHTLAQSFWKSPIRSELKNAIRSLTLSRTHSLEAGYFFCFAALDSLTEVILESRSRDLEMPKSEWTKLRKEIEKLLDSGEYTKDAEIVKGMKAKMGELKRASLRRKMLEIVKIQQLDVDDLWPNSDFETGFGEAATVRNDLFHNLKIKSNREMQTNLIRLRYLVERMILSSLGWDKSNRWINNDQDLKFANL